MNPIKQLNKIVIGITSTKGNMNDTYLYLMPIIVPIVSKVIEEVVNLANEALKLGYDIKVKAGPVDIAISRGNII